MPFRLETLFDIPNQVIADTVIVIAGAGAACGAAPPAAHPDARPRQVRR